MQRQGHDQTHHHPIIIGAKMWESKRRRRRIGSWRRPAWMDGDGDGDGGQNKRDVQGKQAKELKSRQRWRLLQMNQATSVSDSLTLSFPPPHQASSQQPLQSTPAPPSVSSPTALLTVTAWCMELEREGLVVAFGSCGWGWRVARECLREGTGRAHPWLIDIRGSKWRWRRQIQVGPEHAQANN